METHQSGWKTDRNRERERGRAGERGENKARRYFVTILLHSWLSLLLFLAVTVSPVTHLFPLLLEVKTKEEHTRVCAVALWWNSRHPSHPLNQHKLHTFVGFGVRPYIFQRFWRYSSMLSFSPCDETGPDTSESPGPREFGTKIKPEMPEGLQAVITTAPVKSSLDGNAKGHVSTGRRRAEDAFTAAL